MYLWCGVCRYRCSVGFADDETAYTLDTYPGHSLDTCDISIDFPTHFQSIFDRYSIFSGLSRLLDVQAILHVDRTATAIHYQSHRSMLHLFYPSYLRPIISLEIEVFSLISHGHRLLL